MIFPEIEWMETGNRLLNGAKLYKELWTSLSPLASYFYQLEYLMFEGNILYYEVFALAMIAIQALYFNYIMSSRSVFLEKNYIPALVYIVLMSVSFDLSKSSPNLMATTFLLLALGGLTKQLENRSGVTDDVFEIGLFLSLAAMFYLPDALFIFWALLSLIAFTGINIRQVFLVITGFVLPIIILAIFYYLNDSLDEFVNIWFFNLLSIKNFKLADFSNLLLVYAAPAAITVLGIFNLLRISRYSNSQTRIHQSVLIFGLISILTMFFAPTSAPYEYSCTIPFMAVFVAGFFIHLKGAYLPELSFLAFLLVVLFIQKQGYDPIIGNGYEHISQLRSEKRAEVFEELKDEKILVTGNDNSAYLMGKSATKYLNWGLSRRHLKNPDTYDSVVSIFDNFKNDPPTYIVDNERVFPKIFKLIPEISKQYVPTSTPNIYKRK